MSLTNPNTPVSQQDLKDLYEQKILPYMGGAFGLVATGIDSANLYSTTERVIGQWIDGKPLYQKTINAGSYTNAGSIVEIDVGANIDRITKVDFFGESASGGFWPVPYVDWQNMDNQIEFWGSGAGSISGHRYIKFRSKVAYANATFYITVQYTKTTDSAVESYGTDTTYSTDEHVVGSWIDGKPLYQKTYQLTFGSIVDRTSTTVSEDISSLNTEFCKVADAQFIDGDNGCAPISTWYSSGNFYFLRAFISNEGTKLLKISTNRDYFSNKPVFVTLQYTKTS